VKIDKGKAIYSNVINTNGSSDFKTTKDNPGLIYEITASDCNCTGSSHGNKNRTNSYAQKELSTEANGEVKDDSDITIEKNKDTFGDAINKQKRNDIHSEPEDVSRREGLGGFERPQLNDQDWHEAGTLQKLSEDGIIERQQDYSDGTFYRKSTRI